MRDINTPKYILAGIDLDGLTAYHILRACDMAVCGMDLGCLTDDGVWRNRVEPRYWPDADEASAYMARIEDGTAGLAKGDRPLAWITEQPNDVAVNEPHSDGVL